MLITRARARTHAHRMYSKVENLVPNFNYININYKLQIIYSERFLNVYKYSYKTMTKTSKNQRCSSTQKLL